MLVTSVASLPRTTWEGEEVRFIDSLRTYDPLQQQPEPPGYPLYVALGRFFNFFVHDPFHALIVMSVVAVVAGCVITALAATALLGNPWTGAAAALILYLSPALLVFGPPPDAEAAVMLFVTLAILVLIRGRPVLFGIAVAAIAGVHPETFPAALALLVGGAIVMRRKVVPAIAAFAVSIVVFFAPLVAAVGAGNLARYARTNFESLQSASAAAGLGTREAVLRFVAHPWGHKFLSFPLLLVAAIGLLLIVRRGGIALVLLVFAAVHIAFCLGWADRGDGVQPVIPALIVVAMFAAAALARWPSLAFAAAIAYGLGAYVYARPILRERKAPSAPAAATAYAATALPPNAVVLYEPNLEAYALHCGRTAEPLAKVSSGQIPSGVPLFLFADGGSRRPGARRFEWPDSDAYGKVTTRRYRVTTIAPWPPASRYRAMSGLYGYERTESGEEWRWLAGSATLELPSLGNSQVAITLGLPSDAPIARNVATASCGKESRTIIVDRGATATATLPLGASVVRIQARQTFSSRKDRRELGVQLLDVQQRP